MQHFLKSLSLSAGIFFGAWPLTLHADSSFFERKEIICESPNTKFNAYINADSLSATMILREIDTDSDFYQEKYIKQGDFPQPQGESRRWCREFGGNLKLA